MATAPNGHDLIVLGLETSCDETAAALVHRDAAGKGYILANLVRSQLSLHAEFGGVVPEIAARAHVELLDISLPKRSPKLGLAWVKSAASRPRPVRA